MCGSVGRLAHSTTGEFGIGRSNVSVREPLHAMPCQWVQVCSQEFMKTHIARLLVHGRSLRFASVQDFCSRKRWAVCIGQLIVSTVNRFAFRNGNHIAVVA